MTSFRHDFKEMTLKEIESTWQGHVKTFGVDGEATILTPWDNVMIVKEILDRLKAQNKWIKSTDQPPPKDIPILAVQKFSKMPDCIRWMEDGTYGSPGFFESNEEYEVQEKNILFWMAAPELPKKELE